MVATRQHTKPYPSPEEAVRRSNARKNSGTASRRESGQPRSVSRSRSRSGSRSRSRTGSTSSARSSSPSQSSKPGSWTHRPSPIIMLWLFISIPLVIWDVGYIYLRPYSMPGGPFHFLWKPYGLYGEVDFMYGWPEYRAGNGFPAAQSTLNVVEVVGYLYYLATVYKHSEVKREGKRKAHGRRTVKENVGLCDSCWVFSSRNSLGGRQGVIALLVIFACSVMTVSKTVLYGLVEAFSNFRDVGHNSPARLILLFIIPNGLWIVFPSYATYYFASEILNALQTVTGVPATEKTRRIKTL